MNIHLKFKEEWLQEYKRKESSQEMVPSWIYVEHNGEYYPDDDWIDNPAVILGWWLYSISEMLECRDGQGLDFMEGPFFIEAYIKDDLLCLSSEDGKISWEVNKLEFAKELIRASNEASRRFYSSGLTLLSENLNKGVKRLRRVLTQVEK